MSCSGCCSRLLQNWTSTTWMLFSSFLGLVWFKCPMGEKWWVWGDRQIPQSWPLQRVLYLFHFHFILLLPTNHSDGKGKPSSPPLSLNHLAYFSFSFLFPFFHRRCHTLCLLCTSKQIVKLLIIFLPWPCNLQLSPAPLNFVCSIKLWGE